MIETENTPNPDTLKFLPGKKVSEIGPVEFLKKDKDIKIPLANKILSLDGTVMVFFGEDFITVKKEKDINWEDLKHGIISEINDYYSKGNDIIVKKNFYTFYENINDYVIEDFKIHDYQHHPQIKAAMRA